MSGSQRLGLGKKWPSLKQNNTLKCCERQASWTDTFRMTLEGPATRPPHFLKNVSSRIRQYVLGALLVNLCKTDFSGLEMDYK